MKLISFRVKCSSLTLRGHTKLTEERHQYTEDTQKERKREKAIDTMSELRARSTRGISSTSVRDSNQPNQPHYKVHIFPEHTKQNAEKGILNICGREEMNKAANEWSLTKEQKTLT